AFDGGGFATMAGFGGDGEAHGVQHRGVALVERHPFFAHGFDSSSSTLPEKALLLPKPRDVTYRQRKCLSVLACDAFGVDLNCSESRRQPAPSEPRPILVQIRAPEIATWLA